MRKEEQMLFFPETKKIKNAINWKPKTSLSTSLNKTIKYYSKIK